MFWPWIQCFIYITSRKNEQEEKIFGIFHRMRILLYIVDFLLPVWMKFHFVSQECVLFDLMVHLNWYLVDVMCAFEGNLFKQCLFLGYAWLVGKYSIISFDSANVCGLKVWVFWKENIWIQLELSYIVINKNLSLFSLKQIYRF